MSKDMMSIEKDLIFTNYVDVWQGEWKPLLLEIYEAMLLWVRTFYTPIESFAMERAMHQIRENAKDKLPISESIAIKSIPMRKDALFMRSYWSVKDANDEIRRMKMFERGKKQNPFLRIFRAKDSKATYYLTHPCLALLHMMNAINRVVDETPKHVNHDNIATWLEDVEACLRPHEETINDRMSWEEGVHVPPPSDVRYRDNESNMGPLFKRMCYTYRLIPETGLNDPLEDMMTMKHVPGMKDQHREKTYKAFGEIYSTLKNIWESNHEELLKLWQSIFLEYKSRKDTGERNAYTRKFVEVKDNDYMRCQALRHVKRKQDQNHMYDQASAGDVEYDVLYEERGERKQSENVLRFYDCESPDPMQEFKSDVDVDADPQDGYYHAYDWECVVAHEYTHDFMVRGSGLIDVYMVWENCLERSQGPALDELLEYCHNITIIKSEQTSIDVPCAVESLDIRGKELLAWVRHQTDDFLLVTPAQTSMNEMEERTIDGGTIIQTNNPYIDELGLAEWINKCTQPRSTLD